MAAGAICAPGEIVDLIADREVHQLMIGRVKLDRVQAHPVPVERSQLRPMAVGLLGPVRDFFPPKGRARSRQPVRRPVRAHRRRPLAKGCVARPEILIANRRRHVEDVMRRQVGERGAGNGHGGVSFARDGIG